MSENSDLAFPDGLPPKCNRKDLIFVRILRVWHWCLHVNGMDNLVLQLLWLLASLQRIGFKAHGISAAFQYQIQVHKGCI